MLSRQLAEATFEDLATQARQCGYRVGIVADQLGHSSRWLECLCHKEFGLTPRGLLARLREEEIRELARTGMPAKMICQLVGFADAASFCHGLKRSAGCTLRELRELAQNERSQKDNKDRSPSILATRQTVIVPGAGPPKADCGFDAERWSSETKQNRPAPAQGRLGHK